MKMLFIADASSIHTRRWIEYFRDNGHDVHIASFNPYPTLGVTVHALHKFKLGKIGYFLALWNLPRIFRSVQPDIVHAHYVTSYGFLAALSGLKPLVVTAWGSDVLIAPETSRVLRFFTSYALRKANAVTTVAEHMNAAVIKLGANSANITATPFGVDTNLFRPIHNSDSMATLKLICTRNFSLIYDIETLIRAIYKVTTSGRKLDVELVGEGPLRQSLMNLVSELGLSSSIKFLGHVKHDVLPILLAKSDIFVSPALSDGNNVSLNEAMASGCFPIATNIPANSQWIVNSQNGYLYTPGSIDDLAKAIEDAIDNSPLRISAKLLNRNIAMDLADWRVCVRRMELVYSKVCGRDISV